MKALQVKIAPAKIILVVTIVGRLGTVEKHVGSFKDVQTRDEEGKRHT